MSPRDDRPTPDAENDWARNAPRVDEDLTGTELDPAVLRDLQGFAPDTRVAIAQHLAMVGRLIDEDPESALEHALVARKLAPRVAATREALGLAAYRTGDFALALKELRTARRMSGQEDLLVLIADCERGLGRPTRALELVRSPEARALRGQDAVEMALVEAGARADAGQAEVSRALLQQLVSESAGDPWEARVLYAYAQALLDAGERDQALDYFLRAADVDLEESTDAAQRAVELAAESD